jgi:hypothetical protein
VSVPSDAVLLGRAYDEVQRLRAELEEARREALLSLAAGIEALNDWPKLESITEETHQYARGVIKGIAEMARRQAQQGQGSPSGSPGIPGETPGPQGLSVDLRAAGEIPAEVVAAALRADHEEGVRDGRSYHQVAEHQVRRLIAGAVAAERERIYAHLGNDHYVTFTEDGWTTEHSAECRLSGQMGDCDWLAAVRVIAAWFDPGMLGRWRITGISEGLPDLERAEPEADDG